MASWVNNRVVSWKKRKFDEEGNLLLEETLDSIGQILRAWIFRYDSQNREIYQAFQGMEGLKESHIIYNSIGDIILKIRIKDDNIELTKNIYIYDTNRNWIEKIIRQPNKQIIMVERIIQYWQQ